MTNTDPTSLQDAYGSALRLLNARDYTAQRLREKLSAKGCDEATCQTTITRLQEEGWLNDERFAERFAESALGSGKYFGQRLRQEMKRRGFSPETVANALEQVTQEHDEEDDIRILVDRRYPGFSYTKLAQRDKNRVLGYLQRKGFGIAAIIRVLKTYS